MKRLKKNKKNVDFERQESSIYKGESKKERKQRIKSYNASNRQKTITMHVWFMFIMFVIIVLGLLWLFQYVFLQRYYQSMKVRDLESLETQIESNIAYEGDSLTDDSVNLIHNLAFKNTVCIVITDSLGNVEAQANYLGQFSYFSSDIDNSFGQFLSRFRNKLMTSGKTSLSEIYENEHFKSKELLYVTRFSVGNKERLMYLESALDPVESTARIINQQLIFISFILLEISFVISIIMSRKIAKPIVKITETANEFAKGNYNVHFDGNGYQEAKELADVLNNAGQEIQKVTDLRKDLIANVSHDLRTPLTMIKAYAEMIRDISGDNPEKRQKHIDVIIDEADRLSYLVDNILEVSKLESGNSELELSSFSINEKLDDIIKKYDILVERDGYKIELIKDEDRICVADQHKLEQVVYNLINNAVNYCGDDKTVIVRQINLKNSTRIEIIDHGVGISKELLPTVFDRYYRDKKVARDTVGTGLGLSIVKGILTSHNFPFGVTSTEGKGSVFWFEITDTKEKIANR